MDWLSPRAAASAALQCIEPPLAIPGFARSAAWHERSHHDPAHRRDRALPFETCSAPVWLQPW